MKIDLTAYSKYATIRFLDRETGKELDIEEIVSVIDEDTGDYTGYKVVDKVPVFDDDGRPVVVNKTVGCAVVVQEVGGRRPREEGTR